MQILPKLSPNYVWTIPPLETSDPIHPAERGVDLPQFKDRASVGLALKSFGQESGALVCVANLNARALMIG